MNLSKVIPLILFIFSSDLFAEILQNYIPATSEQRLHYVNLLTSQSPSMNPDGVITVTVKDVAQIGYAAYAHAIIQILAHEFPERKLRMIMECSEYAKERFKKAFSFPEGTEVHYITDYSDATIRNKVEDWLEEASVIIQAATTITALDNNNKYKSLYFGQMGLKGGDGYVGHDELIGLLTNFLSVHNSLPPPAEGRNNREQFTRQFWIRTGFFQPLTDGQVTMTENKDSEQTVNHWIEGGYFNPDQSGENDSAELCRQNPPGDTLPENSYTFDTEALYFGLSKREIGILIKPSILLEETEYKTDADDFESPYELQFEKLLHTHPELDEYIGFSADYPKFYMSYMHNKLSIAEYYAIVSHLNPEKAPVILTNTDTFMLDGMVMALLARQGVGKIFFTDLTKKDYFGKRIELEFTLSENTRSIHLIKIPFIKDDDLYLSLFAQSASPVGVTGNMSLFSAIALGKLPFYDVNFPFQAQVNKNLARFDESGQLHPFFSNTVDPELKAEVVRNSEEAIAQWSKNILAYKSANRLLTDFVHWSLEGEKSGVFHRLGIVPK